MLVVVAGGTGFVGRHLVRALERDGHRVISVSRQARAPGVICWNQVSQEGLPPDTEAVIQLAGRSILQLPRWTEAHKKEVLSSRLQTGGVLIGAMRKCRPKVYMVASAVGYYPSNTAEPLTEDAAPGTDFAATVCVEVEKLADTAAPLVERVVKLRLAPVLARGGGMLQQMWWPFYCGLGGALGSGTQPMPWVHMADVVGLIRHALATPVLNGPLNVVSPEGGTNYDFTKALGKVLGRPTVLPVPGFALRAVLGEQSAMLLDGQRVTPAKALATGYTFQFPTLEAALTDIRDHPDA